MPLVDYDSSGSEDEVQDHHDIPAENLTRRALEGELKNRSNKKQKTLPSLPETFATGSKDDPSLHQGRKRTRPYVDGEYNAHVYLSLSIPSSLRKVLEEILTSLQDQIPNHEIYSLVSSLHISLTNSLPLRRHQIIPFRNELTNRLKSIGKFKLSFTSEIKVYYNRLTSGEEYSGGRAFLALRVGAGAFELDNILNKIIHPLLNINHLPTYHENPEFHTSFGWTLLRSTRDTLSSGQTVPTLVEDGEGESDMTASNFDIRSIKLDDKSKGNKPFTDDMVKRINVQFRERILDKQPKGGWVIDCVYFKVAKEVHILRLSE
ncbi:uncharacterized protein I206_102655 [Kwoniella pini CBS 10737]|uniref:U6 snRNA phosphodiesterase 1 n=1 Tax=Kwoniella pini CBS 10737 TaxID=1296096 RepID=A0A1B9I5Z9_9TREE|nr:uncharacterized protein I206_03008 [Kwoniella pini CBS 10737]OCF50946.1 hypothetical protein I206_03008 [Kwoniella pini CBS 10737]